MKPYAYATETAHEGFPAHSKTLIWPEQYTGNPGPIIRAEWGTERIVPLYTLEQVESLVTEKLKKSCKT